MVPNVGASEDGEGMPTLVRCRWRRLLVIDAYGEDLSVFQPCSDVIVVSRTVESSLPPAVVFTRARFPAICHILVVTIGSRGVLEPWAAGNEPLARLPTLVPTRSAGGSGVGLGWLVARLRSSISSAGGGSGVGSGQIGSWRLRRFVGGRSR